MLIIVIQTSLSYVKSFTAAVMTRNIIDMFLAIQISIMMLHLKFYRMFISIIMIISYLMLGIYLFILLNRPIFLKKISEYCVQDVSRRNIKHYIHFFQTYITRQYIICILQYLLIIRNLLKMIGRNQIKKDISFRFQMTAFPLNKVLLVFLMMYFLN